MCLDLKWWSRKRTAKKDIVVYKFVETIIHGGKNLVSPYQGMDIKIGETYHAAIVICGSKVYNGFHSLKSLRQAKKEASKRSKGKFTKCIIPKGSVYYNGIWDKFQLFNPIGYVSDSIKYVELLN